MTRLILPALLLHAAFGGSAQAQEKSPWTIADKVDGKESAQFAYLKPDQGDSSTNTVAGITYRFADLGVTPASPTPYNVHFGFALAKNTQVGAKVDTRFAEAGFGAIFFYDRPGIWWQPLGVVTYKDNRAKDTRGYVARFRNTLSGPPFYDLGFRPIGAFGFLQAYNDFGLYYDRARPKGVDDWDHAGGAYFEGGLTIIPPLPTGRWGINAKYGAARDTTISGDRAKRSTQYRSFGVSYYLSDKKDRKADNSIPRITYEWFSGAYHLEDLGREKYQQITLEYRFN